MIDVKCVILQNPEWLKDVSKLKSALKDFYPDSRREINAIINALECGIPEMLSNKSQISDIDRNKYVSLLINKYGIQTEIALEAVMAWAHVYDIKTGTGPSKDLSLTESFKLTDFTDDPYLCAEKRQALQLYINDVANTNSIKSCCSIIDICSQYATNIYDKYSKETQQKYYNVCLKYLEKLKELPKHGKYEEAYNYLAYYVEGFLHFINADWIKAIRAYNECARYLEVEDIDCKDYDLSSYTDSPGTKDSRLPLKITVHRNLYFIYKLLGMHDEKRREKRIVDAALTPYQQHYEEFQGDLDYVGKLNELWVRTFLEKNLYYIIYHKDWTKSPRITIMRLGFIAWRVSVSSDLATALDTQYSNHDFNISRVDSEQYIIRTKKNIVSIYYEDHLNQKPKVLISDLARYKQKISDTIRFFVYD